MSESLINILIWVGIFVGVVLFLVGLVLGSLFLGMRLYYPDERHTDRRE